MSDQNPLFIPGPTNIPDRLRQAMDVQTRDHRAPDFVDLMLPVQAGVKNVLGPIAPVYCSSRQVVLAVGKPPSPTP